jgi:GNAT superfamily N-acetyltransferase
MDPIVTTLFGTVAWQLGGAMTAGDRYDLRFFPDAAALIGGMPAAFANWLLVDDGPQAARRARELVAAIETRHLPGILVVAAAATDLVAPVATDLGLVDAGTGSWMVCRPERTLLARDGYRVTRVMTDAQLHNAYTLMADAFAPYDYTMDVWNNVFGAHVCNPALSNLFVAYRDDEPFSAVTTTGAGEVIGIWSMATPPPKQRQGAGRAALEQAMAWHLDHGATTFYLMATDEGLRLYEQTGFRIVTQTPIWLVGSDGHAAH